MELHNEYKQLHVRFPVKSELFQISTGVVKPKLGNTYIKNKMIASTLIYQSKPILKLQAHRVMLSFSSSN